MATLLNVPPLRHPVYWLLAELAVATLAATRPPVATTTAPATRQRVLDIAFIPPQFIKTSDISGPSLK